MKVKAALKNDKIGHFVWACPSCNFGNKYKFTPITDPEVLKRLEADGFNSKTACHVPEQVACVKCEDVFETCIPGAQHKS